MKRAINFRQLEAFRAIVERGTTTKAAETMGISQPAVSKLISHLELSAGFSLFDRVNGRLVLTLPGKAFLSEVDRVFLSLERVNHAADAIREGRIGHLSIACMPSWATGFLARSIERFVENRKHVTLAVHPLVISTMRDWLINGLADLAVGGARIESPLLASEIIATVEGVCVLHKDHRSSAKEVITPHDLAGDSFISLRPPLPSAEDSIDAIFRAEGLARELRFFTTIAAPACAMVAQGLGVTVVSAVSAHEYHDPNIVIRPFVPVVNFPVYIHYLKHPGLSDLARDFVAAIRIVLRSYKPEIAALTKADASGD